MNYFDPERPQLAEGVPCYVGPNGKPIAALQDITVRVLPGRGFELSVMLMCGSNTARWYEATVESWSRLARVMLDYREDPERVLKEIFGYDFKLQAAAPPQPKDRVNISIDELFN